MAKKKTKKTRPSDTNPPELSKGEIRGVVKELEAEGLLVSEQEVMAAYHYFWYEVDMARLTMGEGFFEYNREGIKQRLRERKSES